MKTIYPNLEELAWTKDTSAAVNPIPPDAFDFYQWNGGMTTMIRGPQWSGGLVHTPALPVAPNTSIYTLAYDSIIPGSALTLCQALEFDLMLAGQNGFVANGSCQCVVANGFMWQIWMNNKWTDTGIKTPLTPDSWVSFKSKFKVDWAKQTIQFQSITVGSSVHTSSVAPVPFQQLGWGQPNILSVQRQLDLAMAGAYSVDDRNISVTQE